MSTGFAEAYIAFLIAMAAFFFVSHRLGSVSARLTALRSNAYLTDKDGVRRRYYKVSPEVRAKAEQ